MAVSRRSAPVQITVGIGARPHEERVRETAAIIDDDTELCRQFSDNGNFRRRLPDSVFALTYPAQAAAERKGGNAGRRSPAFRTVQRTVRPNRWGAG
jgi:hypothetical protein